VRLNTEAHAAQPTITSGSTELAIITTLQTIVPVEFFKAGGSNDILTNLENEVRAQAAKLDISTKAGRDAIASLAYRVACSKKPLENLRKGLTEDIRKQKEAIDAEGRKADERIEALKIEVRKPLTDWENAEKERVAAHEEVIRQIEALGCLDCPLNLEEIEARAGQVSTLADRDWQEFKQRAVGAKVMAMEALSEAQDRAIEARRLREQAERLEAEARERAIKEREEAAAKAAKEAADRRAEEQARIAREAAERELQRVENERIEAEARAKQAEAERIAVEQKAERDIKEAAHRAVLAAQEAADSERRAIAQERQRLADQQAEAERAAAAAEARRVAEAEAAELAASAAAAKAERERYAAVEAERQRVAEEKKAEADEREKRERNKKHRAAIEMAAIDAVESITQMSPEDATAVIRAIGEGLIPNVTISY
jgi:hypothetical protein